MKTLLQYGFMVIAPLLVMMGLLNLGAGLKAPVSVGGAWDLVIASPPENISCKNLFSFPDQPRLTITQSGPELQIKFNDLKETALKGKIDRLNLSALTRNSSLQFEAEIVRQAGIENMQGVLKISGCANQILVTGTRLTSSLEMARDH